MFMKQLRRPFGSASILVLLLAFVGGGVARAGGGKELLMYDVKVYSKNRKVTKCDRGFPKQHPQSNATKCIDTMIPGSNGNWISPVNYAGGTLYMRAKIHKQPVAQDMRLQFCAWQNNFTLETCSKTATVSGKSGTVVTWSQPISEMWKKDGKPLQWGKPRQRYGIAIKNRKGLPVSDYNGWNWNGENPNNWYPLDMDVTVVVVPKGGTFSGWSNYPPEGPAK